MIYLLTTSNYLISNLEHCTGTMHNSTSVLSSSVFRLMLLMHINMTFLRFLFRSSNHPPSSSFFSDIYTVNDDVIQMAILFDYLVILLDKNKADKKRHDAHTATNLRVRL